MKLIRSTLLVAGISALLLTSGHAQQISTASPPDDWQTLLQAIEALPPLAPDTAPLAGNFYSFHYGGSRPPLPRNIKNLPFWSLGDGIYVVDDRSVDYAQLQAEAEAAAALRAAMSPQSVGQQRDGPEAELPCGDGGPVCLTNVVVADVTATNCTVTFTVAGGSNEVAYCLYRATNLVADLESAGWQWLQFVHACDTVVLSNQPGPAGFYVVAPEKDTDGDGIPDWWEVMHGLNPLDPSDGSLDPDDDGKSNLQEYQAGENPFDAMLVAWGDNASGQSTVPWGFGPVTAMAGGGGSETGGHTVLLTPQGTVLAWGANDFGQTNVPSGLSNLVAVAAGGDQSLALKTDGTVVQWGRFYADIPVDLTNATAISAGYQHLLALQANGTVISWGQSNCPANTIPAGLNGVKAIAAGWNHNLALRSDGTVVAWGLGGQALGWNLTNVPAGLTDIVAIAAGALHSVMLRSNGTVVAWGSNAGGETNVPAGLCNVVAIAAGRGYTLALRQDGTLAGWGLGQPALPMGLNQLKSIAAGPGHALALRQGVLTPMIMRSPHSQGKPAGATASFEVWAGSRRQPACQWQFNAADIGGATNISLVISDVESADQGNYRVRVSNGAGAVVSDEAALVLVLPPVIVAPVTPQVVWAHPDSNVVLSVSATAQGIEFAGLTYRWYKDGQKVGWSIGTSNLILGMFDKLREGHYSVVVSNVAGSTSSVPWSVHVMNPGTLVAWGGDLDGVNDPPYGMTNILAVAVGHQHAAALTESGTVLSWGSNAYGQTNVPAAATSATAVACGSHHTLALRGDGTLVAWGRDQAGETEVPADLTNVLAIAAGGMHNVAVTRTGDLRVWGMDIGPVPANLTDVTAIAAGLDFNVALKADGTVTAWGGNGFGQTNVPANLSNVVAISAGDLHGLALRNDGTVVGWGSNSDGQTDVPPDLTNAMAIAAGSLFSMALRNDGTVVAWGDNTFGQTNVPAGLPGVKSIAAAGAHAVAGLFSTLVQYPVDVTRDLLLIYNTNSVESTFVKDYYLAHRPMVTGANVLGIGCPGNRASFFPEEYTNNCAIPVLNWLTENPTKRPQYVVLFLGIPWRVNTNALVQYDQAGDSVRPSVQFQLNAWCAPAWHPFVTAINMSDTRPTQVTTNACVAYVNKLASIGSSNPPGRLILSASAAAYGNTNYYFDDSNDAGEGLGPGDTARRAVLEVNPAASVVYTNGWDHGTNLGLHITNGLNLAGYLCHGIHSALGNEFPGNGRIRWQGNSGWWLIGTLESFNGQPCGGGMSDFYMWFSSAAFGGTNYSTTPIGAVTHVDEPYIGVTISRIYFGLWEAGKNFGICAWEARFTPFFQAVGDPFVTE